MWIHFFLENAHFALNIFGALVMFAVAWLYFDAFLIRRAAKEGIRTLGFLLLSLSFIAQATVVESGLISAALIPPWLHIWLFSFTRIPGFICIIVSLYLDPMNPKPVTEGLKPVENTQKLSAISFQLSAIQPSIISYLLSPLLVFTIGIMYFRRATIGLERHLKRVSISFLLLALSEVFALRALFLQSTNIDIYQLTAPFGLLWVIQNLLLILSLAILCRWVFAYLLKRFETQLFMIFTIMILVVFLITTISFTGLLVKNLVDQTLGELTTDAKVLALSLESKQQAILSDAELFAQDPAIVESMSTKDRQKLVERTAPHLLTHKLTSLVVVDPTGIVSANGEDPERFGYSLSGDSVFQQALAGQTIVSLDIQEGTITPNIIIRAASPIKKDTTIIGVVISGSVVDTALLDGIKKATGLEASIYADTKLSATTILSPDGITRPIGTQEQRPFIRIPVMEQGIAYTGAVTLLNRPYFASYLPLKNIKNDSVGMLFVGKPQSDVLATAGRSIELTFVVTAILLIVSVFPAYMISWFIVKQIR